MSTKTDSRRQEPVAAVPLSPEFLEGSTEAGELLVALAHLQERLGRQRLVAGVHLHDALIKLAGSSGSCLPT